MTDAQMTTIAAAFLAAVIAVLFNNSRIGDLRTDVNKRMDDLRTDLNKRMDEMRADLGRHIDDKYSLVDAKLDRIIDMLASHDERISRLEGKR